MNPPVKNGDRKQALLASGIMADIVRQLFPSAKSTSNGQQILAHCPFHQDSNPSLSIQISTGLYHCFSCPAKGDGFDLYMKLKNCDFKTTISELEAIAGIHHKPTNKQKSQVVATFFYHDESGNRRYWKKRYEPGFDGRKKSFAFYHDVGGNETKGRGGNSLLYNLHLLKAVSGPGPVFFVEGEAKADALTSWGLCATSLDSGGQSGKGATWSKEFTGYFSGKDVYILPDNDPTGEEYAASIADLLLGVAASVKVLRLPDLPAKGDILDWIKLHR
jgi:putative DNA primase/helicase